MAFAKMVICQFGISVDTHCKILHSLIIPGLFISWQANKMGFGFEIFFLRFPLLQK